MLGAQCVIICTMCYYLQASSVCLGPSLPPLLTTTTTQVVTVCVPATVQEANVNLGITVRRVLVNLQYVLRAAIVQLQVGFT